MKETKIHVEEQQILKWPEGWSRTLIPVRKSQASWKKNFKSYRDALLTEMERIGVTDCLITVSANERLDPGVAIHFSRARTDDFSWQSALEIENPAPTLDEIDTAFRKKAMAHHPDRGGDPELYRQFLKHREAAKAWVLGQNDDKHGLSIACDRFNEARLNLNAIRLAMVAFRQLDRVGIPGILEKTFTGFKTALAAKGVTSEQSVHA